MFGWLRKKPKQILYGPVSTADPPKPPAPPKKVLRTFKWDGKIRASDLQIAIDVMIGSMRIADGYGFNRFTSDARMEVVNKFIWLMEQTEIDLGQTKKTKEPEPDEEPGGDDEGCDSDPEEGADLSVPEVQEGGASA